MIVKKKQPRLVPNSLRKAADKLFLTALVLYSALANKKPATTEYRTKVRDGWSSAKSDWESAWTA
jgi:hypothetical protein